MFKNILYFLKSLFIFLLFLIFNMYLTIFIFVKVNPDYMKDKVGVSFFNIAIILLAAEYFAFLLYRKNKMDILITNEIIKQKKKKPKIIILITIVFLWAFIKNIGCLFRHSTVTDYIMLNKVGFGYLFFVFSILLLLLEGFAIWFLWKPKPIGFWIAISSLCLLFLESTAIFLVAINNVDVAKYAYMISRQTRGLSLHEEVFKTIFSVSSMYTAFTLTVSLILLWISLLVWERDYFRK